MNYGPWTYMISVGLGYLVNHLVSTKLTIDIALLNHPVTGLVTYDTLHLSHILNGMKQEIDWD